MMFLLTFIFMAFSFVMSDFQASSALEVGDLSLEKERSINRQKVTMGPTDHQKQKARPENFRLKHSAP